MPLPLHEPIDWVRVAVATSFYARRGYQHVEVPWVVPPHVSEATLPPGILSRKTQDGDLIGSGEQGLLALAIEGRLAPGLYQTTTPCFRDDVPDRLHGKHFVKVELMHLAVEPNVEQLIDAAVTFFSTWVPVHVVRIDDSQWDIVDTGGGVELGSYGIREALGVRWAYGTGVAEPRMSTVQRSCSLG